MSSIPEPTNAATVEPNAEATELAHTMVDLISDRQGSDIILLDLRTVSLLADYFILASADNRRQMRAIVDAVQEGLGKRGIKGGQIEGTPESGWIVLDQGSVVVHLFDPEARNFYKLEQLWKNAPTVLRIQ